VAIEVVVFVVLLLDLDTLYTCILFVPPQYSELCPPQFMEHPLGSAVVAPPNIELPQ
jgi:hypothetical protein